MQPNPALESFLRSIPLFSLVQQAEMMDILRLLRPITLESGAVLFREGEPGTAMWVLGEGTEVSISATPIGGNRPMVVARAGAGETVGEMALVDDGGRSGTVVVTHGGPAHQIDAVDFQALRDTFHPAAFKVLRKIAMDLCSRIRATSDRIVAPGRGAPTAAPLEGVPLQGTELLEEFPAFRTMPEVVKLALSQKLTLVETDGVQPIFGEGAPADAAYFVLQGEVTVGRNGKTLNTIGPGGMFGLVAAIDAGTRSASCVATGPTRLLRLADADFDALFAKGNRFAYYVVDVVTRQLVHHLRGANQVLLAQASAPPPEELPVERDDLPMELDFEQPKSASSLGEVFGGEAIPLELDLEITL